MVFAKGLLSSDLAKTAFAVKSQCQPERTGNSHAQGDIQPTKLI
jgi:hypothetical protein